MYMTFFLPIESANLPENGLEIADEMVKSEIINPFCSAPPRCVINSFNSGIIKLKLVMKKNIDQQITQKFLLYLNIQV